MQTLVLCMLFSLSLPLTAAEKTPKLLIYEYESASLPKKSQALRDMFRLDPSKFSKGEFSAIVDLVRDLEKKRSTLLGEVPELWQISIVQAHPELRTAFPKLKVARAPHKHHAHSSSSAATDEKRFAAASSSAAATPSLPHPRKVPLKIHVPGKVIEDKQLVARLTSLLYQGQYSKVRQFFDKHPDTMNLMWSYRFFNTLLMDLFENPPEQRGGSKATAPETLTLIRYLLSKNVNVIYKDKYGKNALEVAINYHRNIPREAREEIILKIVDLMLKQGVAPATIAHQIQALQDSFQDLITQGEVGSVLTPPARGHYSEFSRDFQENLKLLEAARAPLEALAAQGPLEEAGLPPELGGIVREYRVGGREHKQKAADFPLAPVVVYKFWQANQPSQFIEYLDQHPEIINSRVDSVSYFNGPDSGIADAEGNSLLMWLFTACDDCSLFNLPVIQYLLAHNVDVLYFNWQDRNALNFAIDNHAAFPDTIGDIVTNIVNLMLNQGALPADIDHQIAQIRKGVAMELKQKTAERAKAEDTTTQEAIDNNIEQYMQPKPALLDIAQGVLEGQIGQEQLEETAQLPPEIAGIAGEYRGRKQPTKKGPAAKAATQKTETGAKKKGS